jgi:flavin reductase (DIM6/NTAB) family NADH-FMN oxidoreductase RutF
MKMVRIDPTQQSKLENYKILIGSVLPRPIAFVTSVNGDGVVNAAPFSFFTVVSTDPPMVGISVMRKPGGIRKDTAANIAGSGEFVVHVVDRDNVAMVNETSVEFPPGMSEAEEVGFRLVQSDIVKVPGLMESKIRMECRLHRILPLGGTSDAPNVDFIIGEVVRFHIADELYRDGKIDTVLLDPVGRLAGTAYGTLGEMFSMPRLSYEEWKAGRKRE